MLDPCGLAALRYLNTRPLARLAAAAKNHAPLIPLRPVHT